MIVDPNDLSNIPPQHLYIIQSLISDNYKGDINILLKSSGVSLHKFINYTIN